MRRAPGFFRGKELPSLLVLVVLLIGGWLGVLSYLNRPQVAPPDNKPARLVQRDPLPPADNSLELQAVVDRAPLNPRENPAYGLLLDRARATSAKEFAAKSRRDVLYGQVMLNPKRYRGIPLHIRGSALRVQEEFTENSQLFPNGKHYEAWIGTNDSRPYFWHVIFDEAPPNLPVGDNPGATLTFDGYFFKVQRYLASNRKAAAEPLLIGKLQSVELDQPASVDDEPTWRIDPTWIAIAAVIVALGVMRWLYVVRKVQRTRTALPRGKLPVTDQIDPDALKKWLNDPSLD